ncbi:MAG TPA: DUF349 domain-containing protein, partial [Fibrella sp.]
MTNEEQQIDRPEEVSQPDNQLPETTTATDEVASTPVSDIDEAAAPTPAEAPIAEQPAPEAADQEIAEPVAEQPTADASASEPTTATSEAADSAEAGTSDESAISEAEVVDEPEAEAVPAEDPVEAGIPYTTQEDAEEPVAELNPTEPVASGEAEATYGEAEAAEEAPAQPAVDYSNYSKQDLVNLLDQTLNSLKGETVAPGLFRQADDILKQTKPVMDQLKRTE